MSEGPKKKFIDAGTAESEEYELDEEVKQEFEEAQRLGSGSDLLKRELREHHSRSPELSGGDIDADWAGADVGDETVGGSAPTPDQDVVEEIGEAIGLTYEDNEPLHTVEKLGDATARVGNWILLLRKTTTIRVNHEGE